jgi:SAM-dependent methyltransferase
MTFTAHNVLLPNGEITMPELNWLIADSSLTKAAIRSLQLALGEDLSGKSIVDLGCLEGGYTLEFAKLGMRSVGVEVRESNLENCRTIQQAFNLPNLEFVQDDVWNLEKYGSFDAAFCCGLLYHLDRPAAFIDLLGRSATRVVIIHTHFAREDGIEAFPQLSDLTENEGLPGRWYGEHAAETKEELEALKWTSWENRSSFWLTRPAIYECLMRAGYTTVYEQFDWFNGYMGSTVLDSTSTGYYHTHARGMFIGVRS